MPRHKIVNGVQIQLTSEEETARDAEEQEADIQKKEYEKTEYRDKRMMEFPSYGDQLDYIFHHGLAKWKTDIVQPVKDKFPKPE